MREFKTADGDIVDLDYPSTYYHLPDDCQTLDDMMFKEIGHAICYMDYFHPELYGEYTYANQYGIEVQYDGGQRARINEMIKDFCDNRRNHYNDVMWYQEKLFLFQDETENMC